MELKRNWFIRFLGFKWQKEISSCDLIGACIGKFCQVFLITFACLLVVSAVAGLLYGFVGWILAAYHAGWIFEIDPKELEALKRIGFLLVCVGSALGMIGGGFYVNRQMEIAKANLSYAKTWAKILVAWHDKVCVKIKLKD